MKAYETCPVCGGLNCGTACTNVGRWLTPAQRQDAEEASPRQQVADLKRERDEAQEHADQMRDRNGEVMNLLRGVEQERDKYRCERDEAKKLNDWYDHAYNKACAHRDAARAQVAALQDALRDFADTLRIIRGSRNLADARDGARYILAEHREALALVEDT